MDLLWQRGLDVLRPSEKDLQRGLELHRTLPVCEGYGFLPGMPTPSAAEMANALLDRGVSVADWKQRCWTYNVTAPARDSRVVEEYFAALKRSGIRGMVQNVSDIGESLEYALMNIAAHRHLLNSFKKELYQATSAEDLLDFPESIGVYFSLTGLPVAGAGSMADPDAMLDWLDIWYHMGVRFMHLSYNRRNYFADGCTALSDGGLSDLGVELIARLNKTGIIVDVPHSSSKSTMAATKVSTKPVIATHTGSRAIHDHPRCKTDEEMKAIAGTGGYVGILGHPMLLGPNANLNLMMQHVQHAVKTVGAEHVAIGTDYGYRRQPQEGLKTPPGLAEYNQAVSGFRPEHLIHDSDEHMQGSLAWTNWPLFTVGLVQSGFTDKEIESILGGNLRRVLAVTTE